MNSLEQLIEFLSQLADAHIQFDLKCVRDAIMVTVVSPGAYYEIEFFADGHIEVQTFGPASSVQTVTLREITNRVVRDVNG
ncbi:MAG: hypothetical protein WBQ79_18705 [Acidobacteriaceae bacterium]